MKNILVSAVLITILGIVVTGSIDVTSIIDFIGNIIHLLGIIISFIIQVIIKIIEALL